MESSSKVDMLHGPVLKKIIYFAIPLAIGSTLQQLFNAIDSAVVGRFASSQALAAVGANGPVVSLFVNLFIGISVGSGVLIANYIGSGQEHRISDAVHTSIAISLVSGVFLMGLVQVVAAPLLTLMQTPSDVIHLGVLYLRIYAIGMPFILIYNFGSAILRSAGDSKRPVYSLIVGGVINAILNVIFVVGFHRSVDGVAIATVMSNVVSSSMVMYFLMHEKEPLRFHFSKLRFNKEDLMKILNVGVPAGLQGVVFSISNVVIQSGMNGFGGSAMAGSSVAVNFEYIGYFIVNGFSQAAVTFIGQNYGARKMDRCRLIWRTALICGFVAALCSDLMFVFLRQPLIGLFTKDPAVIDYANRRVLLVLIVHWLIASYEITASALRGYGKSLIPALLTVFGTCVVRIVWVYVIKSYFPTYEMLLLVYPVSWVITGTIVIVAYFITVKKVENEVAL